MLEPWNDALLVPPPVNTFHCKNKSLDLTDLNITLADSKQILSSQSALHQEAAILSRLIYKFDKKFRHDIGYKNLKKVNTALKKYLKVNLLKDIEYLAEVVPSSDSGEEYLPTRQMLQYVLVRLISFCKIMVRIIVCSKTSAIFYWDRVTRAESHWMSLMPYAVMSRIWSLCSVLLKQSCKWYAKLYKYHDELEISGMEFLPEGYSLPDDIDAWLNVKDIDELGKVNWSKCKLINVASSIEEDDVTDAVDIFQYIKDVNNETETIESEETAETQSNIIQQIESAGDISGIKRKFNDAGEKISRDNFNIMENTNLNTETEEEATQTQSNIVQQIASATKISKAKRKFNDVGEKISRDHFNQTLKNTKSTSEAEEEIVKCEEPKPKKIKLKTNKTTDGTKSNNSIECIQSKSDVKIFVAKEERFRNGKSPQSLSSHLSFMQWQSLKMAVNAISNGLSDEKFVKKFKKLWKNKCTDYIV